MIYKVFSLLLFALSAYASVFYNQDWLSADFTPISLPTDLTLGVRTCYLFSTDRVPIFATTHEGDNNKPTTYIFTEEASPQRFDDAKLVACMQDEDGSGAVILMTDLSTPEQPDYIAKHITSGIFNLNIPNTEALPNAASAPFLARPVRSADSGAAYFFGVVDGDPLTGVLRLNLVEDDLSVQSYPYDDGHLTSWLHVPSYEPPSDNMIVPEGHIALVFDRSTSAHVDPGMYVLKISDITLSNSGSPDHVGQRVEGLDVRAAFTPEGAATLSHMAAASLSIVVPPPSLLETTGSTGPGLELLFPWASFGIFEAPRPTSARMVDMQLTGTGEGETPARGAPLGQPVMPVDGAPRPISLLHRDCSAGEGGADCTFISLAKTADSYHLVRVVRTWSLHCNPGQEPSALVEGECISCEPGFFSPAGQACQACPENTSSDVGASACQCSAGFGFDQFTQTCVACENGLVKPLLGDDVCMPCPESQVYVSATQCSCDAGYFALELMPSLVCEPCQAGSYQPDSGVNVNQCLTCLSGMTSQDAAASCECMPGHIFVDDKTGCKSCPKNQYRDASMACSKCGAFKKVNDDHTACKLSTVSVGIVTGVALVALLAGVIASCVYCRRRNKYGGRFDKMLLADF